MMKFDFLIKPNANKNDCDFNSNGNKVSINLLGRRTLVELFRENLILANVCLWLVAASKIRDKRVTT